MEKQISNTPVLALQSLKLVAIAIAVAMATKLFNSLVGFVPAMILVGTGAALIPIIVERRRLLSMRFSRLEALNSIQEIKEAATMHREWFPSQHLTLKEMKERFLFAQDRALALHQELYNRSKYLDLCQRNNLEPLPGATFHDLKELAEKVKRDLEAAAWVSKEGVSTNAGLLDLNWNLGFIVHDVKPEEAAPERVVVPMGEFEHLRKVHKEPCNLGTLVSFSQQERSSTSLM